MPTTDKKDLSESENFELIVLLAKRDALFARMNEIHKISLEVHLSSDHQESLLCATTTLDDLRSEFLIVLDNYNALNLKLNPTEIPNFQPRFAFDNLYCRVQRVIKKIESVSVNPTQQSGDRNCLSKSSPRLPAIELMTFDGDIKKWPFFFQQFTDVIHNNPQLTDSDRVHYLLGKLSDRALSVCTGVPATAENYSIIWKSLVDKYEDTRALASSYLDQLFDFSSITKASASSLDLFIDKFSFAVKALQQLKINDLLDFIFFYLATKKLDPETNRLFEMFHRKEAIPKYNDFIEFIKEQAKLLTRTSEDIKQLSVAKPLKSNVVPKFISSKSFTSTQDSSCIVCNKPGHQHLYQCQTFLRMIPRERFGIIKKYSYCNNCLSSKHKFSACNSQRGCAHCSQRHHTLLHFDLPNYQKMATSSSSQNSACAQNSEIIHSTTLVNKPPVKQDAKTEIMPVCNVTNYSLKTIRYTTLLGTAKIKVIDRYDKVHFIRCLLDSGSQSDYISLSCCNRLSLPISKTDCNAEVLGIGGVSQKILGTTSFTFSSRFENSKLYHINPFVIPHITGQLPDTPVDSKQMYFTPNSPFALSLADDQFNVPGDIDILLGVNIYAKIILPDKLFTDILPIAMNTELGYVLMGDAPTLSTSSLSCSLFTQQPLDQLIQNFWKLEELPPKKFLSLSEQECENLYISATTRDSTGRYSIDLPFKEDPHTLGDSYKTASKRYLALERKFEIDSELRNRYNEVITEYIQKQYLSLVPPHEPIGTGYYIPHHPVIRSDKATTKLRIVLDASTKTDSGISLNDILHTGVNLQTDIFYILLNVRLYKIAFFADVRQMYLGIGVHKWHRKYQRILYRFTSNEQLQTYEFNRVTFGLRSSPFIALRTLRQLAQDEKTKFPLASAIVERDIYMDDLASSTSTLPQAKTMAQELIAMFKAGGFELVKWTSNSPDLLKNIPTSHRQYESITFDNDRCLKILGLQWLPVADVFNFSISVPQQLCTKRHILSTTARLYDVLGLIGPVILYAKLLIKQLWLQKIDWDDVPPQHIACLWQRYVNELSLISQLNFPRYFGAMENSEISLIGFSDASERAYGCVIYLRVVNKEMTPVITLVCSKSRVAPVKVISLARLELCGLVLMSRLIRTVCDSLSQRHRVKEIYAFSDSMIALHWVHSSPHKFQTFVANRISECQSNVASEHFYHIAGINNPSDCLSRGLTPSQFIKNLLWLNGPEWLRLDFKHWPITAIRNSLNHDLPEMKTVSLISVKVDVHPLYELAENMSSWSKLLRCIVYIYRFIRVIPHAPFITAANIRFAELQFLKLLQLRFFSEEIKQIHANKNCTRAIQKLAPFFDKDGIIRVGGRLRHSDLSYNQQHPILLPRKGHVINLIITYYHLKYLHAGPQLLISILRQRYWILSARRAVRSCVHKCNVCFRLNPKPTFPLMADLPPCRLQSSKAFTHTGVDFAGPLLITISRRRGVSSQKAYLCLFVCLVTHAIHLELASDLSTHTFLNCFKRFLARRGPCKIMYSDHGTNFVGAKSYFKELFEFLRSENYYKDFSQYLVNNLIEWKMNPPNAPHFGGIWEANVKCVKRHLFKVIGNQILSYEEMTTVLTQIEALLNSRPLYVLSPDPSEPTALTSAHFLLSAPLNFIPAPDLRQERLSLLSRFSLLDSLVQSFWKRFKLEYLHNLQSREKWNTPSKPVAIGTVVILSVDNAPPLQWPLGIITRLLPGKDGIVRVVEVKTKSGIYTRPVVRLCPLPTQ